jgi:hypothetical protein
MTIAMRARRLVLLAFFAYVVVDLGCPLVPGAFSFDPDDSVDAVSAYRIRPPAGPRVALVPSAGAIALPPAPDAAHAPEAPAVVSLVGWRPHAGRDRTTGMAPRPSPDDD